MNFFFFLTKPVALVISFSNSILFVSYLRNALVSTLFTLATNLSYITFLTTSFFNTSLSLFKSRGTFANWSISYLSTSVFKIATFDFNAKLEVPTCDIYFISVLLHK